MSQNFLTADLIAKESLMRLRNQLVMKNLVHVDFSDEFKAQGDTVQIRKPATFTANDFTGAADVSVQDIVEQNVNVKLDKIADVTVEVTAKELSLNIEDFGKQVSDGAMQALAQKIDYELCQLYKYTPYYAGTLGNNPATLAHLAGGRKVLMDNKAPLLNRRGVFDPTAAANLLQLDVISKVSDSGQTAGLREAQMGRVLGLDLYESQNMENHTRGSWHDQSPQISGTPAAGSTTITVKNLTAGAHVIKAGDLFTINAFSKTYTVVEGVDVSEGSDTTAEIKIYPGLEAEGVNNAAITVLVNHATNLIFHRDAFALVTRPMALPIGGAWGAVESFEGLTLRVTADYGMARKKNTMSFDILYGVKCLEPKLAVRVSGTA